MNANSKVSKKRFSGLRTGILTAVFPMLAAVGGDLAAETCTITGDVTGDYSSLLTGYDSITASGNVKLTSTANGSNVTLDWYVPNGSSIASENRTLTDTGIDPYFGSGTIYMQDGSTLKSAGSGSSVVNSALNISGTVSIYSHSPSLYLTGTITGDASAKLTNDGGYLCHIQSSNPNYAGSWSLNVDYVRLYHNDSLGTGTIYFNGGALNNANLNAVLTNDIVLEKNIPYFSASGPSITLAGKLTGSSHVNLASNQYPATRVTILHGNGSEFTGNWNINEGKGNTQNTYAPLTVLTNNTSAVKNAVTNADDRFGSGSITIGNGILGVDGSLAYVHNDIHLTGFTSYTNNEPTVVTQISPFSFDGKQLFLTGSLSGDADIKISNTTAPTHNSVKSRLYFFGDNSAFTGDWHLENAFLVTNASNTADKAFGSGTITLNGGAGLVGWSSNSTADTHNSSSRMDAFIYNDIINHGVNYLVSSGDSVNGTSPNFQLSLRGNISGDGVLVRVGGGYRCQITGSNSAYSGDWVIVHDFVASQNNSLTNAGNDAETHTDARFGSGTIYLNGGGIQDTNYVFSDITVSKGQTGSFRNTNMTLYGTLTANGTVNNSSTLTIAGTLQGTGKISGTMNTANGSVIAPGSIGVFSLSNSGVKTAEADQSIGTLTFQKNLNLQSGTILEMDVQDWNTCDQIILTSENAQLSMDGVTLDLQFADNFDFSSIEYQDILDLDLIVGAEITGTPTLKYDESILERFTYPSAFLDAAVVNGQLQIFANGDQNAVPEPGTMVLFLAGAGLGVLCLRRRK